MSSALRDQLGSHAAAQAAAELEDDDGIDALASVGEEAAFDDDMPGGPDRLTRALRRRADLRHSWKLWHRQAITLTVVRRLCNFGLSLTNAMRLWTEFTAQCHLFVRVVIAWQGRSVRGFFIRWHEFCTGCLRRLKVHASSWFRIYTMRWAMRRFRQGCAADHSVRVAHRIAATFAYGRSTTEKMRWWYVCHRAEARKRGYWRRAWGFLLRIAINQWRRNALLRLETIHVLAKVTRRWKQLGADKAFRKMRNVMRVAQLVVLFVSQTRNGRLAAALCSWSTHIANRLRRDKRYHQPARLHRRKATLRRAYTAWIAAGRSSTYSRIIVAAGSKQIFRVRGIQTLRMLRTRADKVADARSSLRRAILLWHGRELGAAFHSWAFSVRSGLRSRHVMRRAARCWRDLGVSFAFRQMKRLVVA